MTVRPNTLIIFIIALTLTATTSGCAGFMDPDTIMDMAARPQGIEIWS